MNFENCWIVRVPRTEGVFNYIKYNNVCAENGIILGKFFLWNSFCDIQIQVVVHSYRLHDPPVLTAWKITWSSLKTGGRP